jgi:glutathione S-transferase
MPPLLMKLVLAKVRNGAPWLVKPIAKGVADAVDKGFIEPNLRSQLAFV